MSLFGCDVVFRVDHLDLERDGSVTLPPDALDAPGMVTFGPWSAPAALGSLNTLMVESDASLTADGLTIYFTSDRSGTFVVYRATRANVGSDFAAPQLVAELVSESARYGQVGGDDRSFYYTKYNPDMLSDDVYMVSRNATSDPFATSILLNELSSGYQDLNPGISDDMLVAVISRVQTPSDQAMYLYERASVGVAWTMRELVEVETPLVESAGSLSPDGLVLVFHSDRVVLNGTNGIYITTRAARGGNFDPPQLVETLSGVLAGSDPHLSVDQTMLVFNRDDDLWITTRERR